MKSPLPLQLVLLVLVTSVGGPLAAATAPSDSPIQLNVASNAGIRFVHTDGSSGQRYIVETVAAGLALFDYNKDDKIDLYFLNGAPLKGTPTGTPPRNALYRNDGNWKFTDVTRTSGLGDLGYGLGVATADYDNDGDQDVYLNNFGPNKLYRNNGDGTFTDVTASAGVSGGEGRVGAGAAFLDMENDGDLDLFVANYVEFSYTNHQTIRFNGHPAYAGPLHFKPTSCVLFRNNGNGTFTDVSKASGVGNHTGAGMGVVCFDAEDDGDTDIFVANDSTGNSLFINDGKGTFEEMAGLAGLAFDAAGRAQGSMGAACADADNDGLLDLYVTTYQQELATLFRNIGDGLFDDVTRLSGAGSGTLRYVKWGVGMIDFDNDTHRDLFVACGHLHDNVHLFDTSTSYESPPILLRNMGQAKFSNQSTRWGTGSTLKRSARGAAFDDLDNDGDIDVVILNSRREPTLLRNDSAAAGWIGLQLTGTKSNRDAVGAKVRLVTGDVTLVEEVRSGRGYQSDYGRRLHFGLGEGRKVDRIEIKWPSGQVQLLPAPAPNQLHKITEPK